MSSFQLSFLIQFWKRICTQTNLCDWLFVTFGTEAFQRFILNLSFEKKKNFQSWGDIMRHGSCITNERQFYLLIVIKGYLNANSEAVPINRYYSNIHRTIFHTFARTDTRETHSEEPLCTSGRLYYTALRWPRHRHHKEQHNMPCDAKFAAKLATDCWLLRQTSCSTPGSIDTQHNRRVIHFKKKYRKKTAKWMH